MLLPVGAVAVYRSLSENKSSAAAVNVPLRTPRMSMMSVGLLELDEAVLPGDVFEPPAELEDTRSEGW